MLILEEGSHRDGFSRDLKTGGDSARLKSKPRRPTDDSSGTVSSYARGTIPFYFFLIIPFSFLFFFFVFILSSSLSPFTPCGKSRRSKRIHRRRGNDANAMFKIERLSIHAGSALSPSTTSVPLSLSFSPLA